MNIEFWLDEAERLYREGLSLQRAVLMIQLMKINYED